EAFILISGQTPFPGIIAARSHTSRPILTVQCRPVIHGPRSNDGQTIKVVPVGYARKRIGRNGKPRYTAYYLDIRGKERSAGTYSNTKDARDAWKEAEGQVRAGKQGDPSRGRQTFQHYVQDKCLPNHQLEPGVRRNYAGQIRKHLLPFFGPM